MPGPPQKRVSEAPARFPKKSNSTATAADGRYAARYKGRPVTSPPQSPDSDAPADASAEPSRTLDIDLGARFGAFRAGLTRPIVFFDIEATGTDPLSDRIVEISLLRVEPGDGAIERARTFRINPEMKIPLEAVEIHGITDESLADAPRFSDLASALLALIADCDLGGFSIGRFDVRMLQAEFIRAGTFIDLSSTRVVDSQVIFHRREPRNLSAALRFYRDKDLEGAHGAEADTVASLEVFAGQLERYEDLELDIEALHEVSASHNDAFCDLGRRFMWRDNEPTFNFGRLRGKSLRWVAGDPTERRYLKWFLEGHFEEDAKTIVREALKGRIRRRKRRLAAPTAAAAPSAAN